MSTIDPTQSIISVNGLTKSYTPRKRAATPPALDDVSFGVRSGAWTTLLGPNGSGKSTLLRILATLDRPPRGVVTMFGVDPALDADAVRRRLGVVFQHPGLDALLTVGENLRLQASLTGLQASDARQRIDALIEEFDLTERVNQRVGALSGGLARRVDLARAIIAEPELLLLDEPTTGLDPASRASFIDLLQRRRAQTEMTIILSTHLMSDADAADDVLMLDRGRIVANGSPAELCGAYGDRVLVADPSSESLLDGAGLHVEVTGGSLIAWGGDDDLRQGMSRLAESGATFRHGPPTLNEVYLKATGRHLEGATDA